MVGWQPSPHGPPLRVLLLLLGWNRLLPAHFYCTLPGRGCPAGHTASSGRGKPQPRTPAGAAGSHCSRAGVQHRQGPPIHLPQPQIQIHGEMGMVEKLPMKFRVPGGFLPLPGAMPVLRRGRVLAQGSRGDERE